jgi:acetoin utilization deacetylase AcuC-like enzyme
MKPFRIKMTDALVQVYDLYNSMQIMDVNEEYISKVDLTEFHSDDYIDCLANLSLDPDVQKRFKDEIHRFNLCQDDCPIFNNMADYCKRYTSGSLLAATEVAQGNAEFAINWAGGLHHAKKFEASGFCYVNDCVLSILELLKYY